MSTTQEQAPFQKIALLNSTKILICRPEPSASELASTLEALGANCLTLPMLNILEKEISATERQSILDLDQYQHIIVVSQHAANFGMTLIDEYWPQAPVEQKWYAIGRKTAQTLNSTSFDVATPSEDLNSETLLENQALKSVDGEKVLILKGVGGRDIIEQTLSERGAQVDTVCLYTRSKISYTSEALSESINQFNPDYLIALSGETLTNLIEHCQHYNIDLSERSFILSSNRVANIAYENGIKNIYIPDNLMPMDIVRCIKNAS